MNADSIGGGVNWDSGGLIYLIFLGLSRCCGNASPSGSSAFSDAQPSHHFDCLTTFTNSTPHLS